MADAWTDRLSEYLDGELSDVETARLKDHLSSCQECVDTLEQLRAVVGRASNLADTEPEADLWTGISARLRREAEPIPSITPRKGGQLRHRKFSFSIPQLLAAGIALMAIPAGSVWLALSGDPSMQGASFADVPDRGAATVLVASFDNPEYENVVADLERTLQERRSALDPNTIMVLERSLATIDRAILEAREALVSDPTNTYLSEHLSSYMERKVRLLRQATRIAVSAS